ncbi:neuronal acetylcholine receptor subunit alpha-7-like [Lineus longissimus]|uniref:neuronal acetylcholine receptor subunit alpha-7-like n=1 Tax=Lineus longissimus TaxID=88925 RepID=UPI002B4C60EE
MAWTAGLGAVVAITILLQVISVFGQGTKEAQIKKEIFKDYDPTTIPRKSMDSTLTLKFGVALISIADLDEKDQCLTLNVWVRYFWNDHRLKWDPNAYGKEKQIRVSSKNLWTPDVMLYNNADRTYGLAHRPNAVVNSNGDILWIPIQQLKSSCTINLFRFPRDSHKCELKFGSWTFDGTKLDLQMYENSSTPDLNVFQEHDEWEVNNFAGKRNERRYKCCPEPYPDITYSMTFERRSTYYNHVFVAPGVLLILLIPFLFLMPFETDEKTIGGIGIMISLLLMILMFEVFLPSGLSTCPLLVHYYAAGFVVAGVAVIFLAINANIWRTKASTKPPNCLAKVFLGTFGRVLRIKAEEYRMIADPIIANQSAGAESAPNRKPSGDAAADGGEGGDADGTADTKIVNSTPERNHAMEWRLIALSLNRLSFLVFLVIALIITIGILTF